MPSWDWSEAFKGGAGGAAAGTAILPGWGTAIGAGAGGLLGGMSGGGKDDEIYNQRLREYYGRVRDRTAPQAGPAALAQASGFQTNQRDLVGRLEALSRGEGPSLATEQLRQATDRNMAQQASIAQTGRGNAALASIMAGNNSARLGQAAAGDAATARIAEQQMALQQLGSNINAGRQSDESTNQFNAQQMNFRERDNLEAKLRTMGYNDQAIQAILGLNEKQAEAPTFGDQLMAGGAGMLSMGMSNKGKK